MATKLAQFRKAAEDQWAADEARADWSQWQTLCADESLDYAENWLAGQAAYWSKHFDEKEMAQYRAELIRLNLATVPAGRR
jgi:hypothetical protein